MAYLVVPDIPEGYAARIRSHVEETGEPLLRPPEDDDHVILAERVDGMFFLEDPSAADSPPEMTWAEYAELYAGMTIEEYAEEYDLPRSEWYKSADESQVYDSWLESMPSSESASGMVFDSLCHLELGRKQIVLDDSDPKDILGWVRFVDGEQPGHDYRGVQVSSPAALSALQFRLDLLGAGITISVE